MRGGEGIPNYRKRDRCLGGENTYLDRVIGGFPMPLGLAVRGALAKGVRICRLKLDWGKERRKGRKSIFSALERRPRETKAILSEKRRD